MKTLRRQIIFLAVLYWSSIPGNAELEISPPVAVRDERAAIQPSLEDVQDDRLKVLDENLAQVEQCVTELTRTKENLTFEINGLNNLLATWKPQPVIPIHIHFHGKNDCCQYDIAQNDCQRQVAAQGLNLCKLGGGVYFFSPFATNIIPMMTWYEASDYCRQHGMELASIESPLENALLQNKVATLCPNSLPSNAPVGKWCKYWTSLNDINIDQTYIWWGTGLPSWPPAAFWHALQAPQLGTPRQDCGVLSEKPPAGPTKWDDRDCKEKNHFICELSKPCIDLITVNTIC